MEEKKRQRILVVDDDQDLLRLLNRTLEKEGFDTIVVADGDVAARVMDSISPDLVILDSETPGEDSMVVLDHMRAYSEVPIIVLSTEYEAEMLRNVISHGADDFVRKPFVTSLLVARIRAKIRRAAKKPSAERKPG
ncbi:MAG: response regulator [Dehalococcoidales bacterium]|nr:response regulator [Dehalococcoidales bacterium]